MTELWPLLALAFSFVGACIISYNQIFKIDGRAMAVWRLAGILPLAVVAWYVFPWPTDPLFYGISALVGIGAVFGDVLLMNAVAKHGGRLSSTYVPMKMLLGFVLWVLVDPASLNPLLATPWRLALVLAGFALAAWGMNHIRRTDSSWQAVLAVLPVALTFALCDVVEKWVLPAPEGRDLMATLGGTVALLTTGWIVGAVPVMVSLRGLPRWNLRDVLASAGFGVLLMLGIGLLLVAFVLAPNPGYVGAITCLSTVWLGLWAHFREGESNSLLAILMVVAGALSVAWATL